MLNACKYWRFTLWGKATIIDSNYFTINDGSGVAVKVYASGYTNIANGNYVSVTGEIDASSEPVLLISKSAQAKKF